MFYAQVSDLAQRFNVIHSPGGVDRVVQEDRFRALGHMLFEVPSRHDEIPVRGAQDYDGFRVGQTDHMGITGIARTRQDHLVSRATQARNGRIQKRFSAGRDQYLSFLPAHALAYR